MPQEMKTRTRSFVAPPLPLPLNHEKIFASDGSLITENDYPTTYPISSITPFGFIESVHSVSHKGPPFKEGGPFMLKRFTVRNNPLFTSMKFSMNHPAGYRFDYDTHGYTTVQPDYWSLLGLPPQSFDSSYLVSSFSSFDFPGQDLAAYGPTAIRRFSPLKPGANSGQALVELLHDGLPKLPLLLFNKLKNFRSLGSEYLNVQFGWAPFLKDLQDLYKTWHSIDSRISQIIRDNGKPIRRKGSLSKDISTDEFSLAGNGIYNFPSIRPLSYVGGDPKRSLVRTTVISQDIWFSGSFRYYLPFDLTNEWTPAAKLALFGLNPTPSLLYEVMPWSWLIDWFSNIGDVISNLSSNGIADLIIDYGYIMRHSKTETTWYIKYADNLNASYGAEPVSFSNPTPSQTVKTIFETKERVAATPFGFGLQIADLSDRQLAILTALGLSRSNF